MLQSEAVPLLDFVLDRSAFAVIPTVVLAGPLSLLALLFPVLSAALAVLLRRWLVLLSVLSLSSTLYLLHAWFHGSLQALGWGSPTVLPVGLALVALGGVLCSVWRKRAAPLPARGERWFLTGLALAILGLLLYPLAEGGILEQPWRDLLALGVVVWTGALYALALSFLAGRRPHLTAPTTECVMLVALAGVWFGLAGLARSPRSAGAGVEVAWTFEPVERGAIISSPMVAGEHVYVAVIRDTGFSTSSTSGVVYCLDRATGRMVWRFDDGGRLQHMYSSPCLADGRLYLGEGMHANHVCRFYCLDATTGRKLWHFETAGHIESSPCVAGGKVFFGAGDDGVYCLDAVNGTRLWQFRDALHVDVSPTVVGQRLYAGSGVSRSYRTAKVFCLDTETGRPLWLAPTELPVWGSPAVSGEQAFFGLGNGRLDRSVPHPEKPAGALLCLEARTGRRCWRFEVPDGVLAQPAVDSRHVWFGARDGCCYCLERGDGQLCWRADLGSPVVTRPALCDGSVYALGSGGRVQRLDADRGTPGWTFDVAAWSQTRPRLFSSPAVVADAEPGGSRHLYFGSELRNSVNSAAVLYCLRDRE
jgi:outer membrane protein assembly factor BamB